MKAERFGTRLARFEPCSKGDHGACMVAKFENDQRVRCACTCHSQSEMFRAHRVESKQPDLFEVKE